MPKWDFKQESVQVIMKIKYIAFIITILKCEAYHSYSFFGLFH